MSVEHDHGYYLDAIKRGEVEGGLAGLKGLYDAKLKGHALYWIARVQLYKYTAADPEKLAKEIVEETWEDFMRHYREVIVSNCP